VGSSHGAVPASPAPGGFDDLLGLSYGEAKEQLIQRFSVAYLRHVLDDSRTVTEAAKKAGMARPNLSRLLRKFGVES